MLPTEIIINHILATSYSRCQDSISCSIRAPVLKTVPIVSCCVSGDLAAAVCALHVFKIREKIAGMSPLLLFILRTM